MKKMLIGLLAFVLVSPLFADRTQVLSLQKEILELSQQRHALLGENLNTRAEMISVMEANPSAAKQEMKTQLKPLHDKIKANRAKIKALNGQIKSKHQALKVQLKSSKRKKENVEDVTEPEGF